MDLGFLPTPRSQPASPITARNIHGTLSSQPFACGNVKILVGPTSQDGYGYHLTDDFADVGFNWVSTAKDLRYTGFSPWMPDPEPGPIPPAITREVGYAAGAFQVSGTPGAYDAVVKTFYRHLCDPSEQPPQCVEYDGAASRSATGTPQQLSLHTVPDPHYLEGSLWSWQADENEDHFYVVNYPVLPPPPSSPELCQLQNPPPPPGTSCTCDMNQAPSLYIKAFGMHLSLYDPAQGNFNHVVQEDDGSVRTPLDVGPLQLKVSSEAGAGRRVYWLDAKFYLPTYYSTVQQCMQARADWRNEISRVQRMANNFGDVFIDRIDRPGAPPQTVIPPHPGDPPEFVVTNPAGSGYISVHTMEGQKIDLGLLSPTDMPYLARIYNTDGVLLGESQPLTKAAINQMSSLNGLRASARLAVEGLKQESDYVIQIVPSQAQQEGKSMRVGLGQFQQRGQ